MNSSTVECITCSTVIQKVSWGGVRICPDPALITSYLRETCEFEKTVTDSSPICSRCYFSHLRIAKRMSSEDSVSTNDGIRQLKKEIIGKGEGVTSDCAVRITEKSLMQTAAWLLDLLLDNVAVLLADAHDRFLSNCSSLSTDPKPPFRSAHWLLLNLHQLLYPHLRSERHLSKKQGRVLLRNGGDPLAALHTTLAEYRSKCLRLERELEEERKSHQEHHSEEPDEMSFCMNFNSKLQSAATIMSQTNLADTDTINLKDAILSVDPVLWNVIVLLTLSAGERKTLLSGSVNWSMTTHLNVSDLLNQKTEVRFLRRVFVLSVMLYCINSRCNLPLHLALADVIDSYSGSAELLAIMNRLGAASSKDSLERFQVSQASAMNEMVLSNCVNPGSFCTTSIDNIDKNAPFAAVYANQESRGFHGTSIQALEHAATSSQSSYNQISALHRPRSRKVDPVPREFLTTSSIFRRNSSDNQLSVTSNNDSTPLTFDSFCCSDDDIRLLNCLAEEIFRFMVVSMSAQKLDVTKPCFKMLHSSQDHQWQITAPLLTKTTKSP